MAVKNPLKRSKKAAPKKDTAKKVETKNSALKKEYNKGTTIAVLAEKHRLTEAEVYAAVVEEAKE